MKAHSRRAMPTLTPIATPSDTDSNTIPTPILTAFIYIVSAEIDKNKKDLSLILQGNPPPPPPAVLTDQSGLVEHARPDLTGGGRHGIRWLMARGNARG